MNELSSAVGGWLATYFVHSTLLLGATWLATRLLVRSLPIEETLLRCALVLGVASSLLFTLVDRPEAVAAKRPAVAVATPSGAAPASEPAALPVMQRVRDGVVQPRIEIPPGDGTQWMLLLPLVWLIGVAIGLARIVRGHNRLVTSIGSRKLVTDTQLLVDLSSVRDAADFKRPVCLTSSRVLVSPLAIGSVEIAVSEAVMNSLTRAQRVTVLAHEMAHLIRRDPAWRLFGSIIGAIFFFQPLNRIATRRMTEIAEFLADGAAVGRSGHHIALAECLTRIAGEISGADRYAVALTGTPSMLLRRVQRLLASAQYPAPRLVSRLGAVAPLVIIIGLAPEIDLVPHTKVDTTATDSVALDRHFEGRILDDTELVNTSDHNGIARERTILRAHRVITGPDGNTFRGVLPGGRLEMVTIGSAAQHRRVLLKREKDGTVSRTYWVDGVVTQFDGDAYRWMTGSFEKLVTWSTEISQGLGIP